MKLLRSFLALSLTAPLLCAETVKDREGAVRGDKAALENDARWHYNSVEEGFAEAKKTGKPLLAVLRCVPCLSCAGIDASVLAEKELEPLLDKFVCVRIINANALDLAKFQFDYDLSFSALCFNADGSVYGRYGSWTHQKDTLDRTTAGFKATLEAALKLHQNYPANKAALAGKQGAALPYKTPVEIPSLAGRYTRDLDWQGKVVQSCVHCHQIGDALRESARSKGEAVPLEWIFPQPAPETIGLVLDGASAARVKEVVKGSPADQAGIQAGDELTAAGGQSVISGADVAWALHRTGDAAALPVSLRRGSADARVLSVNLPAGWRFKSDISRRTGTWQMRAMASGGLSLEDLPDADRTQRSIAPDALALRVKFVGQYNKHAAAKNAGFQKDDIIVTAEGLAGRMSESEWIGRLVTGRKAGEKLKVTVLRGEQKIELTLPMQ